MGPFHNVEKNKFTQPLMDEYKSLGKTHELLWTKLFFVSSFVLVKIKKKIKKYRDEMKKKFLRLKN